MVFIAIFYSQKVLNDLRMDANRTPEEVKRGFAIYFQSQKVDSLRLTSHSDAFSHSGRRSLITQLAYAGIDLNSIRQISGHSSVSTNQRYIENDPNRMADILRGV